MKSNYRDIRERIPDEPTWYDENGCPRYAPFHPDLSPNIYAREVALLEIACQECGRHFLVEVNASPYFDEPLGASLLLWQERVKRGDKNATMPIHYGDPPRHNGDCAAGDVMNCYDLCIVEFWVKEKFDWVRHPELEITLQEFPDA